MITAIFETALNGWRENLYPIVGRSFSPDKVHAAQTETDEPDIDNCGMCGELVEDCRCLKFDPADYKDSMD